MSKDYIGWLEKAIADEHIKLYKYSDFQIKKQIGKGAYGKVYRVVWKNKRIFALKSFNSQEVIKESVEELKLHMKVNNHENIIRIYGITLTNPRLIINIIGGTREKTINGTPIEYCKLYEDCWKDEPNERPNVQEVVSSLEELISPNQKYKFIDNINENDFNSNESKLSKGIISHDSDSKIHNLEISDTKQDPVQLNTFIDIVGMFNAAALYFSDKSGIKDETLGARYMRLAAYNRHKQAIDYCKKNGLPL
ncbi:10130_t:CDS:2 [Funneliformis mosseae]|uniref:10130_t:CDS:1 n=1 Tax=Funneliformis mosseae TaxID=27381 RepID=A0A9N9DIC8_FUNMO|nr:10130_t:CDS:2 [Funneliformis mosseae]